MQPSLASRFAFGLLELWLAATVILLLIAAAAALRDPTLPIHIGLVNAEGLAAVCATVLPALCGIVALMGLFQHRAWGPALLLLYSLFWLAILVGGMFAAAWRSGPAGLAHVAWHTWLVGGLMFVTMVSGFLVMMLWSLRHLPRHSPGPSGS